MFKKSNKNNKGDDKTTKNTPAPKINIYKQTAVKNLGQQVLNYILIAIVGLFFLYLIFAAMIIRVVPAGSGVGAILIKNNTYHGGLLPEGAVVLVDNSGEVSTSLVGNLKAALPFVNDDVSVVEVKAGPVGKWKWTAPGIVSIDGNIIEDGLYPPLEDKSQFTRKFLENEYLGLCLEGNCIPGDLVIFGANQVMGIPVRSEDIEKAVNEDVNFFPNGQQSGLGPTLNPSNNEPVDEQSSEQQDSLDIN